MIVLLLIGFIGFLVAAFLEFLVGKHFMFSLVLAWISLSLALIADLRKNQK